MKVPDRRQASLLMARTDVQIAILLVIITACCLPFIDKPFHIDDPLFLWIGRNIQSHPGDFYGLTANWAGTNAPMSDITKNPPFTSYVIAAVAAMAGWSEVALHCAFLLVTMLTCVGMYFLARKFSSRPFEAVLMGMLTPVFLLSSTTIMCDMMMLGFWVWSIVLWIEGIEQQSVSRLIGAASLAGFCALTKYFGMSLLILLPVYTIVHQRKITPALFALIIPVALLGGYQWLTYRLYQKGLLFDAASFASSEGALGEANSLWKLWTGLNFLGGCFLSAVLYSFSIWKDRAIFAGVLLISFLILIFSASNALGMLNFPSQFTLNLGATLQSTIMMVVGFSLIALAVLDYLQHRDSLSLLLLLWMFGTFIFATFVNWSVNGRSILPMAPAVGILIMRRADFLQRGGRTKGAWKMIARFIPALCLALAVTTADYRMAVTAKNAAAEIMTEYRSKGRVSFEGHWGFQYYMQLAGGTPLDYASANLSPGEYLVIPANNTGLQLLRKEMGTLEATKEFRSFPTLSCMNLKSGSGFYSDVWGPFPYVFGAVPDEKYFIVVINQRIEHF